MEKKLEASYRKVKHMKIFLFASIFVFSACQLDSKNASVQSENAKVKPTVPLQSAQNNSPQTVKSNPPSSTKNKLDLNDMTILSPLPKNEKDLSKMLALSGSIDSKKYTLLNADIFDKLKAIAKKQKISFSSQTVDAFESWKIVGFRFDPCFPFTKFDSPNDCDSVELRLVAQPVSDAFGAVNTNDFSMHLVYHISLSERGRVAKELLDLSKSSPVDTSKVQLGIHPGLLFAGMQSEFYNKFATFVTKNMSLQNLKQVAFMGLEGGIEPWNFFFVNVNGSNISDAKQFRSLGFVSSTSTSPSPTSSSFTIDPKPTSENNLFSIFQSGISNATEKQMAVTLTIDNPLLTSQGDTDCASCHSTTSARISWEASNQKNLGRSVTSAFKLTNNDSAGGNISTGLGSNLQNPSSWSVRNFGYFNTSPIIADRTFNETMQATVFVNRNFLK